MQGRVRLGEFGLGAEITWDARQFSSLEVKKLEAQVTDEPVFYLARG